MESPVASATSLSVLRALIRSRRSRSPGTPGSRPSGGRSPFLSGGGPSCLRMAAKFSPSAFLSRFTCRKRSTSSSV